MKRFNKDQVSLNLLHRQVGFSLVEAMVTIMISAIILSMAVPSFTESMNRNRINNYSDQLITSIKTAQSQALKLRAPVSMCPAAASGSSCATDGKWSNGWYTFLDLNKNGLIEDTAEILFTYQATENISIIAKDLADSDQGDFISFSAEGFFFNLPDAVSDSRGIIGALYICIPNNADQGRQVTIDASFGSETKATPSFSNVSVSGAGLCKLS